MKQLKIGFVLDDSLDTTDGVQQYVLAVGEWLRAQGHDIHYLVGETTRTDIANTHSLSRNVRVRFNGNRMSMPLPASRKKLKTLLRSEQFDVLHVQMPYSPWLAGRIMRTAPAGTKLIGTFHVLPQSKITYYANRLLAIYLHKSLRKFQTIFAVSEAAKDFAREVYGVHATVLPNVVDEPRFRTAEPLREYDDAVTTIMFLGRLVPRKGCLTLLEATTILNQRKNLPPFRVLICGKGPLEEELRQYVSDHNLTNLVAFMGFVPEDKKPRYLASADMLVFPSTGGESFGIVLLEAMATGRAVVLAGDNPGYRNVLGDRPELLFKPLDAFVLANTITTYLRDPQARQLVIDWQKKYVKQFDVSVVGEKLLEAYQTPSKD